MSNIDARLKKLENALIDRARVLRATEDTIRNPLENIDEVFELCVKGSIKVVLESNVYIFKTSDTIDNENEIPVNR